VLRDYKEGDELLLNCIDLEFDEKERASLKERGWKFLTFQKGKDILSIIGYLQYVKGHFAVFSYVSQDIVFSQLRELKRAVAKKAAQVKAKTFLTFCHKDGKLDRWHKFMGYTKDRSVLFGRTRKMSRWVLKWQQQ